VGAGNDSGTTFDPLRDPGEIPSGSWVGLTPGGVLAFAVGPRSQLRLQGTGSFERFLDEPGGRDLSALSAAVALTSTLRGGWYGRAELGLGYFSDSGLETSDQNAGSFQLAGGVGRPRGGVELAITGWARRFPELEVVDETGAAQTYSDVSRSVRVAGWSVPGTRWILRAEIERQQTTTQDPSLEWTGWVARASARALVGRRFSVWMSATGQRREFDSLPPEENGDRYLQGALRVDRAIGSRQAIGLTYGYLRYEEPGGGVDSGHRFGLRYVVRFGGLDTVESLQRAAVEGIDEVDPRVDGQSVRFRVRARDATRVAVAGDFNGWDPDAFLLRRVGGGWWEITLELPPGSYQFTYVIDGKWVGPGTGSTPVDDGFGGKNGRFSVP